MLSVNFQSSAYNNYSQPQELVAFKRKYNKKELQRLADILNRDPKLAEKFGKKFFNKEAQQKFFSKMSATEKIINIYMNVEQKVEKWIVKLLTNKNG